jgi:hypothetical protein
MVTENIKELIKARLEEMPSHIKLSIGNSGPFSKDELIEHVEKDDEIGETIIDMELNYMRAFKRFK